MLINENLGDRVKLRTEFIPEVVEDSRLDTIEKEVNALDISLRMFHEQLRYLQSENFSKFKSDILATCSSNKENLAVVRKDTLVLQGDINKLIHTIDTLKTYICEVDVRLKNFEVGTKQELKRIDQREPVCRKYHIRDVVWQMLPVFLPLALILLPALYFINR